LQLAIGSSRVALGHHQATPTAFFFDLGLAYTLLIFFVYGVPFFCCISWSCTIHSIVVSRMNY
jgi:hypothetical protein